MARFSQQLIGLEGDADRDEPRWQRACPWNGFTSVYSCLQLIARNGFPLFRQTSDEIEKLNDVKIDVVIASLLGEEEDEEESRQEVSSQWAQFRADFRRLVKGDCRRNLNKMLIFIKIDFLFVILNSPLSGVRARVMSTDIILLAKHSSHHQSTREWNKFPSNFIISTFFFHYKLTNQVLII